MKTFVDFITEEKRPKDAIRVLITLDDDKKMQKYSTGGVYDEVHYKIPTKVFLKYFGLKSIKDVQNIDANTGAYDGSVHVDYDDDNFIAVRGGT